MGYYTKIEPGNVGIRSTYAELNDALDTDDGDDDDDADIFAEMNVTLPSVDSQWADPKELHQDSRGEATLTAGRHVFHGYEEAMEAAFPNWKTDKTEAERFATVVAASGKLTDFDALMKNDAIRLPINRFTTHMRLTLRPERKLGIIKLLATGVKYYDEERAKKKFLVSLGPVIRRRGEIFDSQVLYDKKVKHYGMGTASGGGAQDHTKYRSIWVMAWDEAGKAEFFSHIGKFGRFHHSSFKAGGKIVAAGEWVIVKGKCAMINSCSGHYRPESQRFLLACTELNAAGILTRDTDVEVWEKDKKKAPRRQLVPWPEFGKDWNASVARYDLFP